MPRKRKLQPLLVTWGLNERDLFIYHYDAAGKLQLTHTKDNTTHTSCFHTMTEARAAWPEDVLHDDGAP